MDADRGVLIVGNGRTAALCAATLSDQGVRGMIISSRRLNAGTDLVTELNGEVAALSGHPGSFAAEVRSASGAAIVRCGAVVLAWDAEADMGALDDLPSPPPRCVTLLLSPGTGREELSAALRAAVRLRQEGAEQVMVCTDEVQAFGMEELEYRRAQGMGVLFVRPGDGALGEASLPYVVSVGEPAAQGTDRLARLFKVPLDERGFLRAANVKMGPAASMREGIFLCGTAVRPLLSSDPQLDAFTAVSLAVSFLRGPRAEREVAKVDQGRCSACLTCVRSCPFGAPLIGAEGRAEVDREWCRGCGLCVAACPSRAISLDKCTDEDIGMRLSEALEGKG